MIKKIFFTLINVLSVLVIAAAVVVLCSVVLTRQGEAPSIAGYTVFRITTGSMAPAYKTDELLLVKQTNPEEIKEGDVISFYSTDPALDGAVNTHRVMEIEKDGDHWFYTTKGDANNVVDAYTVDSEYLIGKVIGSSLMLGKLARLVSNPLIFIPIILLPLAVILITNLARTVSLAKKIAKDEEEAAVKEAIQQIREQRRKKNSEEKSNEVNSNEINSNEINSDDNKE